ncbi:putative transcription factor AP2-EREBP family [Lupinus albus]|uniref:Putative transcription factor AP2-EREBP family n=1 Tax=Lupinus albus TaxID=3870 RepID=A0A6A4NPA5_LUPAL|nr:putative transcription factor AP2-EREBP family [Lupinus albus]
MPYNCSLENLLPKHLWTPQLRNLLRLGDKCILYSLECDEFQVPSTISATSSSISSILDAAIDDKHIKECLSPTKIVGHQNPLQRYTMSEKTEESGIGVSRIDTVTSSSKRSIYRGVIKISRCGLSLRANSLVVSPRSVRVLINDERFEAFVWDDTSISSGNTVFIGGYSSEVEAARAHDLVSIKLYGLHTLTNLPVCYTIFINLIWKYIDALDYLFYEFYTLSLHYSSFIFNHHLLFKKIQMNGG